MFLTQSIGSSIARYDLNRIIHISIFHKKFINPILRAFYPSNWCSLQPCDDWQSEWCDVHMKRLIKEWWCILSQSWWLFCKIPAYQSCVLCTGYKFILNFKVQKVHKWTVFIRKSYRKLTNLNFFITWQHWLIVTHERGTCLI